MLNIWSLTKGRARLLFASPRTFVFAAPAIALAWIAARPSAYSQSFTCPIRARSASMASCANGRMSESTTNSHATAQDAGFITVPERVGSYKLSLGPLDLSESYGLDPGAMRLTRWTSQASGLRVVWVDVEGLLFPFVGGFWSIQ